jgi:hypothetical protein
MEDKNKSNDKNDDWVSRIRISTQCFKIMSGIIFVALQILFLLLRAYFSRNDDYEKSMEAIRNAQRELADLATDFETKIRYPSPPKAEVDRIQDSMDEERKGGKSPHN